MKITNKRTRTKLPYLLIDNNSSNASTHLINPLLQRLFVDYDIIFFLLLDIEKIQVKFKLKVLNTFGNIMENGAFAPKDQIFHFP